MKTVVALAGSLVAGSILVASACGGNTTPTPAGSGPDGAATDAGSSGTSGGTSGSSGTTSAKCPSTAGSGVCPRDGLECEYGDDPRPQCRTVTTCSGTSWTMSSPNCTGLPSATCPASLAAADGKSCTPDKAVCNYDGTVCECTNCTKYPIEQCQGPVTWHCESPPTDSSCPPGRPRLGATCTQEGKLCTYGCEHGQSRQCTGGNWASASSPGGCPVSTRKAKTDIHYLSDGDLASLSNDARALRLASWRYRGALDDGRSHVGYILEDAPAAPSSDMKREEVDLYAYTSMTLALAQQQAREIEQLKKEVSALKQRCAK